MIRAPFHRLLLITTLAATLAWMPTTKAELPFQQILKQTPQSRLQFSPYTVGSVIAGASNRVYVLNAQKGQALSVKVNSSGARAFVGVFDSTGKELAVLTERSQPFEYELIKT